MRTFADGQLAASATAIFQAGADTNYPSAGNITVALSLTNTSGAATQTILITFQRQGGTARRIARIVLAANEQVQLDGIAMQTGDTILGQTTNATTVDYVLSESGAVSCTCNVYDSTGAIRQVNGTSITAATTITSASANAFTVGPAGATNPTFNVDASTGSAATGLQVKSAAAGAGLALSTLSSAGAENLTIDAKGTGTLTLQGTATGTITMGADVTMADTKNIILNTGTGTKIGTATTQKLGFYNLAPTAQPAASANSATGTTGASTGCSIDTTFTGGSGAGAYTIGGVVLRLKQLGLIAT